MTKKMTHKEYSDSIAMYLKKHYSEHKVLIYRNIKLGASTMDEALSIDVLIKHTWGINPKVLALKCRYQGESGSAYKKIRQDLADLELGCPWPYSIVYAGDGFTDRVGYTLNALPHVIYANPEPNLASGMSTQELDRLMVKIFDLVDVFLKGKEPI